MRKNRIVFVTLALLLVISSFPVFAQIKGALTVKCDVVGARVYLNGEIAGYARPTFVILLKPGHYRLKVSMPGYSDYETTINMTSNPKEVDVRLRAPQEFRLSISSNVQGADIYINNNRVGQTPYQGNLTQGDYSVRLSAGGYHDTSTSLSLQNNQSINLNMQPLTVGVNIRVGDESLIRNIYNWENQLKVWVDGNPVQGVNFQVTPGTHRIRVETGIFSLEKDFDFNLKEGNNRALTLRLELN